MKADIALVDDHALLRSGLASLLKDFGYTVLFEADNGARLQEKLKTLPLPRVILMDINMPVMDGYESLQRIRAYEKKHHMSPSKAIAVTALGSDAARAEAFGSGFDLFCSKPLKLKDLAMLIE